VARRAATATDRQRVLLLGIRFRPFGIPVAAINRGDFDLLLVDGLLAARYAENNLAPMRAARVLQSDECTASFEFHPPRGAPFIPPDIAINIDRNHGEIGIRGQDDLVVVYTTVE